MTRPMKSRIGTIAGIGSSAASSGKSPNAHSRKMNTPEASE
jgi:hypothetical protein